MIMETEIQNVVDSGIVSQSVNLRKEFINKVQKSMLVFLMLGVSSAASATEIIVDAGKPIGPVKYKIFGHNIESADPRGIFRNNFGAKIFDTQYIRNAEGFWDPVNQKPYPAIVAEAKSTGISMLRYPGGCYAANYDWRKAVGPLSKRGDWRFGLDEYITLCRALGAEPLITCSDYVLPAKEMPQHLAAMVEYLNAPAIPKYPWAMKRKKWGHAKAYGVKWFELGNESASGNYYCKPRRCFTRETYAEYANKSAAAMRKVDPSIKIGILANFGEGAYKSADFIIRHHYGPKIDGINIERNFKSSMAHAEHFQRTLKSVQDKCFKKSGRILPIALTEYNLYYFANKPVPLRYSVMAGLLCADRIRLMIQPECPVEIANYWQISKGYFGMFRSDNGIITIRRAVLAFYQLWGRHFGKTLLPVEIKDAPHFEAPAADNSPAARGKNLVKCKRIKEINIGKLRLKSLKRYNIDANSPAKGNLIFKFKGTNKIIYPLFAKFINRIKGSDHYYRMSFESRFVPKVNGTPPARIGIGIGDSRGWKKTRSAMAIDGLEIDNKWISHHKDFQPKYDCPAIDVNFRITNSAAPLYGTLEIRNFKIEEWIPETMPAYQGITAASSLSKDGKTLHLIVFNKSFAKDIISTIKLKGFNAKSARSWTAGAGVKLDSIKYEKPVEANVPLTSSGQALKLKFPAHSMTAIDFTR